MSRFTWVEDRGQKVWLWIAALFGTFYFVEAFLFWGPQPRIRWLPYTPLVYWGAFGAGVIWLVQRQGRSAAGRTPGQPPSGLQSFVLGIGITISVVGMAYLVMRLTGNTTVGHAILLGALFEAGIVIAGMSGSLGWMLASLVWAGGGLAVLGWPSVQDFTLGLAVAIGFALVGLIRKCIRSSADQAT